MNRLLKFKAIRGHRPAGRDRLDPQADSDDLGGKDSMAGEPEARKVLDRAPATAEKPALNSGSDPVPTQKNRLWDRIVDKLKDAQPESSDSNSSRSEPQADQSPLAETQHGDSQHPPMTFSYSPGSQPLPRYTIRRGIGMGGFGEVYFAVNDAGKEVALKRIQRNLEIELRGASQCLNLKHPNLVALYDICRDEDDQSWVVMEYVAGKNLRQILDQSPNGLPIEDATRWFAAIAAGVHHLHSAGLVHRDLKPGNVFDDLGIVKVGDYGLSKFISASHRGGHTESVGTFHYMAPEIGRGQYGREIDIYALGILLHELLTGRVPFDGESSHEIIVKHLTAIPDLKGITEPHRGVIAKSLEKDPAKRFRSVPEMVAALGLAGSDAAQAMMPAHLVNHQNPSGSAGVKSAEEPIDAVVVDSPVGPAQMGSPHAGSPASNSPPNNSPQNNSPQNHASPNGPHAPGLGAPTGLQQEPLARAISSSFGDLTLWWKSLDRSPGVKAALALAAGLVLLLNSHWLILILTLTAIFYVPYYVLRNMLLHVRQQPTYAEAQRIANAHPPMKPVRPPSRKQWCRQMRTQLCAKRSIDRAAELNTSWIAATMTVFGLAMGAGAIGLRHGPIDAMSVAPYAWMGIVVLMSSFGMLGLGKLWERGEGDGLPRRLVLAGFGATIGAVAYVLNQHLMLPLEYGLARDIDATDLPDSLYANGIPRAGAMMAHFAILFSVLRWWKPVDPLRRRRMSIWTVAVAVVGEWAVHQVIPIPQPAGMMIAGGIAMAIQMSAPWINRRTNPTDDAVQPDYPSAAPVQQQVDRPPAKSPGARSLA